MTKVIKILNIIALVFSGVFVLGIMAKIRQTKMNLSNPIIPKSLVFELLLQDVFKVIIMIGIFLIQLKLYKKKNHIVSIMLTLLSIVVYNLPHFFL
ncbi:MAG TPA: hypothetical protein VKY32_09505 [Flavobacterium sp.]|nr:hypothetical protein [Flavobacterium sp.]